jgi:hypothetical protein
LTALYTLGALSQKEADEFEMHLQEGCLLCETELRDFREVVSQLGYSVMPVSPPANLKEHLLKHRYAEAEEW